MSSVGAGARAETESLDDELRQQRPALALPLNPCTPEPNPNPASPPPQSLHTHPAASSPSTPNDSSAPLPNPDDSSAPPPRSDLHRVRTVEVLAQRRGGRRLECGDARAAGACSVGWLGWGWGLGGWRLGFWGVLFVCVGGVLKG